MTPFSVTKSTRRYRIVGLKSQRPSLPLSVWAAWREAGLFGLPSGALLALPVALRVGGPASLDFLVWLAATGLLGLAVAFCAGLLRMGRPLPGAVALVPLAVLFSAGPLTFLGSLIHANTHHRPLGAATFSVLAVALVLVSMAFAARTRASLNSSDAGKRRFGQVLLVSGLCLSLALGLRGFSKVMLTANSHPTYLASVLDGLLGLSASLVGGFVRFSPKLEQVARFAGPLAIAACVLAILVAMKYPNTSAALAHNFALWAVLRAG
jgi:hypothetical protein